MKILSIRPRYKPLEFSQPDEAPREPTQQKTLELAWTCDECKVSVKHTLMAKSVYSESDIVSAVHSAFNLAFFRCSCAKAAVKPNV